jgi:hypothetical protein
LRQDLRKAENLVQQYRSALETIDSLIASEESNGTKVGRVTMTDGPEKPPLLISQRATMKEVATAVLMHEGRPMGVREIYETAVKAGWAYGKKYESFRMSMFPTLTREKIFRKVERGLYEFAGGK